jgi:hypothetical protein
MTKGREQTGSDQALPQRIAETTPQSYPGSDHSFTLQIVFELQKNVGQLTQAVSTLADQSKDNGKKLNQMSHIIYAAGVVLALILAVGGWTLKIASDIAVNYFNTHQSTQQPATPTK